MTSSALRWAKLPNIPDAEGFAAPYAGVADKTLVVAGGANFPRERPWEGGTKVWYDTIFTLADPQQSWSIAGKLPRPAAHGLSVNFRGTVVCVGGGDAVNHFPDAFVLTWNGDGIETRPLPPMPGPCAFMGGGLMGHCLYVAGGLATPGATTAMDTFWELDLARPERGWRVLPPCPGPARMLSVTGILGEQLCLFSGVSLRASPEGKPVRTYLQDAYGYTVAHGWKRLADLPRPAVAAPTPAPSTDDGKILVLGGDDGTRVHLNGPKHPGFPEDILAYDVHADRWDNLGAAPFSHATVPTTKWVHRWIVPNGERIPGYRTPEVWALEPVLPPNLP